MVEIKPVQQVEQMPVGWTTRAVTVTRFALVVNGAVFGVYADRTRAEEIAAQFVRYQVEVLPHSWITGDEWTAHAKPCKTKRGAELIAQGLQCVTRIVPVAA